MKIKKININKKTLLSVCVLFIIAVGTLSIVLNRSTCKSNTNTSNLSDKTIGKQVFAHTEEFFAYRASQFGDCLLVYRLDGSVELIESSTIIKKRMVHEYFTCLRPARSG